MPTVRIYVQSEHFPDIRLIEIDDSASVADLRKAAMKLLPAGTDVSDIELSVEDDEDDDDGHPHARRAQVKDLVKEHGVRVHLHRCKRIEVSVRFGAEEVHHKFPPATTVGRVRQWAGHKLGMQPSDIAEHVLQIAGSNEQPDVDIHIGTLTKPPNCSAAFDLVPAHRING
jgi:hypothetical protein